jgi:hypothetical protein
MAITATALVRWDTSQCSNPLQTDTYFQPSLETGHDHGGDTPSYLVVGETSNPAALRIGHVQFGCRGNIDIRRVEHVEVVRQAITMQLQNGAACHG